MGVVHFSGVPPIVGTPFLFAIRWEGGAWYILQIKIECAIKFEMEEYKLKKTIKGYLLGFLSASLLVTGIGYAANTTTLYDVLVEGVKIVVDGQKINPTDANGNTVEPIIYNGTTYLPVRAVANAIGKAVYWDGPNYTVYLGNMDGKLEYPTVSLENMLSIDNSVCITHQLTDNYGHRYNSAIVNEGRGHVDLEYLLNMKYSKFKGTVYVPEGETSDEISSITIIADDKTIYTSPEISKTSRPFDIDVNVTGYNDVKIQFNTYRGSSSDLRVCIADAGFYQ